MTITDSLRAGSRPGRGHPSSSDPPAGGRRRRGRPLEMSPEVVLERIRALARREGLFRVHHTDSGLYARARRQFGSWSRAVQAAGLSYDEAIEHARRRSREARRRGRPGPSSRG